MNSLVVIAGLITIGIAVPFVIKSIRERHHGRSVKENEK